MNMCLSNAYLEYKPEDKRAHYEHKMSCAHLNEGAGLGLGDGAGRARIILGTCLGI